MEIASRLKRLEVVVAGKRPGQRTFEEVITDWAALSAWLEDRGYPDCLAGLEAGETGPEGLQHLLREQAGYDPRRRAWARLEAALNAGQLPADVDLQAIADG